MALLSLVFKSHQDNGRVTLKGYVQWTLFIHVIGKISAPADFVPGTARSVGQRLTC